MGYIFVDIVGILWVVRVLSFQNRKWKKLKSGLVAPVTSLARTAFLNLLRESVYNATE